LTASATQGDQVTANQPQTTYEVIEQRATLDSDKPALVFLEHGTVGGTDRRWSFGEFRDEVVRTANMFHLLGVGRDDVVSLLLPNLPEAQFALWGAEAVGIANPVNSYLAVDQIEHILNAAGTKILVVQGASDRGVWDKVQQLVGRVPSLKEVIAVDDPASWGARIAAAPSDALLFDPPQASDVASYFHTGGTTGVPKLAKHTHANEVHNSSAVSGIMKWPSFKSIVMGLPMFHAAGVVMCSLGPLVAGNTIVIIGPLGFRNPRAIDGIWDVIDTYGVDLMIAVPTVLSAILESPVPREIAAKLALTMTGTAPVPVALAQRWQQATGHDPIVGYGLTESGCVIAATPLDAETKPGSVGPALPDCEVRVVPYRDEDEIIDPAVIGDCALGEVGVVLAKGPNIFPGYRESEKDVGVLLDGGWLNTGDLGRLDEDGYLWITGRAKDLIKRGGHGIDPANVEETLSAHPDIQVAAVVGRPDPYAGELPVAYVTLRANVEDFDADLVRLWCKDRVSDPAGAPVEIVALDELPLTAVGKISKVDLRWRASGLAIKREIEAAFAGPFTTFVLELREQDATYVGKVTVRGASERAIALLRRRLGALTVSHDIAIDAAAIPPAQDSAVDRRAMVSQLA